MAGTTKYIAQVNLPNDENTYLLKDTVARELINQLEGGLLFHKCSEVTEVTPSTTPKTFTSSDTPIGVTWEYEYSPGQTGIVTGTLTANSSNPEVHHYWIYLVSSKHTLTGDVYDEYITVNQGTEQVPSWVWETLGSTQLDIDDLGALAYADTATGSVSVSGSTGTITSTGTYQPTGTISKPNVTVTVDSTKPQIIGFAKDGNGNAKVGTLPSFTRGAFSQGTLPTHAADSFSAGSLPTFTEGAFSAGTTPITVSYNSVNESLTFGTGTAPSKAADSFSAGSLPSYTQGTFSAGTLPTHADDTWSAGTLPTAADAVSVITTVSAELASTPSFTGDSATITVSSAGATVTSTGSVTVSPDA